MTRDQYIKIESSWIIKYIAYITIYIVGDRSSCLITARYTFTVARNYRRKSRELIVKRILGGRSRNFMRDIVPSPPSAPVPPPPAPSLLPVDANIRVCADDVRVRTMRG